MKLHLPRFRPDREHPFHDNKYFLPFTFVVFLIGIPFLIMANIAYQGYELAPSFQPDFRPNTSYAGWWGSTVLPGLLGMDSPPCESKDLGRGDIFRLSASLFDYTVMSTWNTTNVTSDSQVRTQERVVYTGEPFDSCAVNNVQFDFSVVDTTQTVTVGVVCPGTQDYPVYVSMETKMVFAWLLSKDFVAQYYGPGMDLSNIDKAGPNDYRKLAFAVLEGISTDSLTIMRGNHLSNPLLSLTALVNMTPYPSPVSNLVTYLNGTELDWPPEANIYMDSIYNLVNVAAHTVNLDLRSNASGTIYQNISALNDTITPNLPPRNISTTDWARKGQSFYYGPVTPPYNTWAEMIRAGEVIKLGEVTGLPNTSTMVTLYLCSSYQLKQLRSLVMSVLIGTQSMFQIGWVGWLVILGWLLKRHCRNCKCENCDPKCPTCICGTCKEIHPPSDPICLNFCGPKLGRENIELLAYLLQLW
ncbi:hypothetical protein BDV93DRAFT_595637 [Ceratobasidium sp. AG-I]|nr:hypothetical protein BDV93DRAFT_595637 [Ceratobasidium sp. AG-I]